MECVLLAHRRTRMAHFYFRPTDFFLCPLRKAALPLLRHGNKVFNLKSILATSQASLTTRDFINESPWGLLRILLLSPPPPSSPRDSFVLRQVYRLPVCVSHLSPSLPPRSSPPLVSDETRHFSWDAILIAVLWLKRLPRSPITLRPVYTYSSYIQLVFAVLSIRLAKALPNRRKLICSGRDRYRLSLRQIDHRLVDSYTRRKELQKNAHNYLIIHILFLYFLKRDLTKILKRISFHLKVRFIIDEYNINDLS